MTTAPIDVAALRRLLDDYDHDAESAVDHLKVLDALLEAAPALLRAVEERDALLAACDAKDDLLACYRLGKRPSEALFKRLYKANEAIRLAKEPKP